MKVQGLVVGFGVALVFLCLAAGCAPPRPAGPTATPVTAVTEAATRSLALAIATHDDFHFTGAAGPITNVRAELLPLPTALNAAPLAARFPEIG